MPAQAATNHFALMDYLAARHGFDNCDAGAARCDNVDIQQSDGVFHVSTGGTCEIRFAALGMDGIGGTRWPDKPATHADLRCDDGAFAVATLDRVVFYRLSFPAAR